MKNIEKNLLRKIYTCSQNNFLEVIIFSNSQKQISNILKDNNIENYYFDFINAFGAKMTVEQILKLSKNNVVEYITTASKVEALMDKAKQTICIEELYKQNLYGQDTTLAIIDTGVSPHLDFLTFKNRIIYFKDFVNNKKNFYDDNGHGSFVSGVAIGNGFLSKGLFSGIAPCANLIMLKALDYKGEANAFDILKAMEWVYDNKEKYNIDCVCMSFGSNPLDQNDPLVMSANALTKKGIITVAAAGNSGPESRTIKSPGVSSKVITVGGINDRKEEMSVPDFSSRGPAYSIYKPDILAPAVEIQSVNYKGIENEPYIKMSGTSVATPIVAGTALLIKQMYPNYLPNQIKRYLMTKTITLPQSIGGGRNKQGYGILNLKIK